MTSSKVIPFGISVLFVFSMGLWSIANGSYNSEEKSNSIWTESNVLQQLSQQFALYESDDGEYYDNNGDYQESPGFREKDLLMYREIFKFVPNITESPFGDILKNGFISPEMIYQESDILEMTFASLSNSVELTEVLKKRLKSLFMTMSSTVKGNGEEFGTGDIDTSIEELEQLGDEDIAQEGGWEGCRRDYNALALPWTNNMLRRVSKRVIGQEFPEGDVDCQEACDTICYNLTDLTNCPGVCTTLCDQIEATNATYDGVVDFLVDMLYPKKNKTSWHRAIFDAMGKVPPAIVHGNIHWVGGYDRCLSIEVIHTYTEENITGPIITEKRQFTGQYYRIPLKPPFLQNRSLEILYGACLPSTCSKEDVIKYITEENDLFRLLKTTLKWEINEDSMFNGTHAKDVPPSAGLVILVIILIFTLFLMVLPATIYDIYFREGVMRKHVDTINKARLAHQRNLLSTQMSDDNSVDNKGGDKPSHQKPVLFHSVSTQSSNSLIDSYCPIETESGAITLWDRLEVLFVAFSMYSNYIRIFRIRTLDTDLPALDSVRFLSYAWAMLGFTWLLGPVTGSPWLSANLFFILRKFVPSWSFQAIINFHFASDSFYVISGILVAYWWLIQHDGKQLSVGGWVKTVLLFYLKRYWRIAPALMFVVLFYFSTYKVFTGGPFSNVQIGDAENCRLNWWTNLLMLSNFVNTDQSCLTWTWFIPSLFQLLIMCPLVLIPLVIKPFLGYIVLLAVYVLHLAITAGIIGSLTGSDDLTLGNWVTDYFFTPWCRAGPFYIGMAFGIILQKNKKTLRIPKWLALLGGLVAIALILAVTYGTYGQFKEGGKRWDRDARVMYNTFARNAFGLGLGIIILLSCTGNGGFIGEFLNWRGFQPLSRLSFSAYLFSSPLVYTQAFSRRAPLWITAKTISHMFLTNMVTTLVVGIVLTGGAIHYPYSLGVERAFFRVKTKEDCIKAGRHPSMVQLTGLTTSSGSIIGIPSVAAADMSKLYNNGDNTVEQGNGSMDQKDYNNPESAGFHRQDSMTSL